MSLCASLPKTQQYLEKEVFEAKADIRRLQEEITALRQKVLDLRHSLLYERCQNKMSKRKLEDTIKCNDIEKKTILSKQDELLTKVQMLEGTVECLNKRVQDMIAENVLWQSQCNKLNSLNERLEKSKRSIENSAKEIEEDLYKAKQCARALEEEKRNLIRFTNQKDNEIHCLKDKVSCILRENDNLQKTLEIKTNEICKLEKESSNKNSFINQLEEKISKMNCELIRSKSEETRAQKEICYLKKELQTNLESKSKFQVENRKFATALETMSKKIELKDSEYEKAMNDITKLKDKISCYTEQFNRIEQIMEEKTKEKEELRNEMKAMETKISTLESANQTLETQNNWTCNNLHAAKCEIDDLQNTIKTKETIICDMEHEMKDLSNNMRSIKQDLSKQEQRNMKLNNELATSKELIRSMERQHKQYESEIRKMENKVEEVTCEIDKSRLFIEELTTQLEEQKKTICCLEQVLSESRREAQEESLQNISVSQKVHELQDSVNKLQDKLCNVNNVLSKCQSTCSEYRSQNNELQFQLVNEKYAKAFRNFCFSCNKYSTNLHYCPCKNKEEGLFKGKDNYLTDSLMGNDVANVSSASGQFTISVNKEPYPSASITVLDCTTPCSATNEIVQRKSSADISRRGRDIKTKDKKYQKADPHSNFNISEFNSIHMARSPTHFRDSINHKASSELKGILKDKSRLGCESPNTGSSPLDESLSAINCPTRCLVEAQCTGVSYKNSSDSSKNCLSENENLPFISIADESPPYRVTKKCYKKVCFSESDDEM